MLDTATTASLVLGSTAMLGILAKFIHSLRGDIKSCCFNLITFRSPSNSESGKSPRKDIEITSIAPQLQKYLNDNKLTLNQVVVNDPDTPVIV